MALVELLFGRKEASKIRPSGTEGDVWDVVFDATISEQGEFHNRITSFPIESGAHISDHIIHEPEELTLEGLISNASLNYLGKIQPNISKGSLLAPDRSSDPVLFAYLRLLELAWPGYLVSGAITIPETGQTITVPDETVLVDVLTEFRLYTSMAIQSLSFPRRSDTGDALVFTIKLKKVRRVSVKEVSSQNIASGETAPAGAERADTQVPDKVETGKQTPEKLQSVLFRGTHIGQ